MIQYYDELSLEEQERMQEIIQLLFRQTFLLERKYDKKAGRMAGSKDFYFCDKHMEFLERYFEVAGLKLCRNQDMGTIYLSGPTGLTERFPMLATIYLLILKLIYDEQMSSASGSVNVAATFGELNAKAAEFRLVKKLSSVTEVKSALRILKKYQMIEIVDTLEELGEDTRFLIYPCVNTILMREDIQALLADFSEEGEEDDTESGV